MSELDTIFYGRTGVLVGKRDLRKLLTLWKHGKVSKRQIDLRMGVGSYRGKYITALWLNRLGVVTSGGTPKVTARTASKV